MALQSAAENCTQFLHSARVVSMRQGKSCTAEAALQFLQKKLVSMEQKNNSSFLLQSAAVQKGGPNAMQKMALKNN